VPAFEVDLTAAAENLTPAGGQKIFFQTTKLRFVFVSAL
jgi:hypothetical protein